MKSIHTIGLLLVLAFFASCNSKPQLESQPKVETQSTVNPLIERGKKLQLKTAYKAPPGDALSHNTAGYAKIMCSAVFITGLKPEFAAENVGYFTSPYAERAVTSPFSERWA